MLLDEYARPCVILVKTTTDDGEGGRKTEWKDDETFVNHQALSSSVEVTRAEQEGESTMYNALVDQAVDIHYGNYFRDETTGQTYRVTSDPDDVKSPASASFSLKHFTAERKVPPT